VKSYTVAGQPSKPKNGYVMVVACKSPARQETEGKILIAAIMPSPGNFIGEVVAIDTDGPKDRVHVVEVGDVIFCLSRDVEMRFLTDGGVPVLQIRECLIGNAVSGNVSQEMTEDEKNAIREMVDRRHAESNGEGVIPVRRPLVVQ